LIIVNFIDNQRVSGNAFKIVSAAMAFAKRHLPIASFFEPGKIQRTDQPAVPPLALREALVNSITHCDYANHSSSIALAIFDDKLELWNNGMLPPQLSIADLRKKHASYPRNERIATIFYEQGWVEGWGTGTTRMIRYCQENGTPEPEFQEYSGGFSVTFPFKEPMGRAQKAF
jgi:ATP-dependent DNA helicase RecG